MFTPPVAIVVGGLGGADAVRRRPLIRGVLEVAFEFVNNSVRDNGAGVVEGDAAVHVVAGIMFTGLRRLIPTEFERLALALHE